jgi:hypothetical protein
MFPSRRSYRKSFDCTRWVWLVESPGEFEHSFIPLWHFKPAGRSIIQLALVIFGREDQWRCGICMCRFLAPQGGFFWGVRGRGVAGQRAIWGCYVARAKRWGHAGKPVLPRRMPFEQRFRRLEKSLHWQPKRRRRGVWSLISMPGFRASNKTRTSADFPHTRNAAHSRLDLCYGRVKLLFEGRGRSCGRSFHCSALGA